MKRILKSLLFLSVLLSSGQLFAQKCNFDVDEVDGFTKQHVRRVKQNFGGMTKMWVLILEQANDKFSITVNMAEVGRFDNPVPAGTKLLFKLEDGTVVEAPLETDILPSVQIVSTNINTQWLLKGSLTMANLASLAKSPIEAFRVTFGGKDYNGPDFKSKQSEKIMKSAGCLMQKD